MGRSILEYVVSGKYTNDLDAVPKYSEDLNSVDEYGSTLLVRACIEQQIGPAMWLIERGADIHRSGWLGTPLEASCMHASMKSVSIALIERGACIDGTDCQSGPLMTACVNHNEDIALVLLERGADVNPPALNGLSVLEVCCQIGLSRVAKALIAAGVDVKRTRTSDNRSVLQMACASGMSEVVEELVRAGASASHLDLYSDSCLTFAARGRKGLSSNAVLTLIRAGCPVNEGSVATPFEYACGSGLFEMANVLLDCGAGVNIERVMEELVDRHEAYLILRILTFNFKHGVLDHNYLRGYGVDSVLLRRVYELKARQQGVLLACMAVSSRASPSLMSNFPSPCLELLVRYLGGAFDAEVEEFVRTEYVKIELQMRY